MWEDGFWWWEINIDDFQHCPECGKDYHLEFKNIEGNFWNASCIPCKHGWLIYNIKANHKSRVDEHKTKINCSIQDCKHNAKTGVCDLEEIKLYESEGEFCSPEFIQCDNYEYQRT